MAQRKGLLNGIPRNQASWMGGLRGLIGHVKNLERGHNSTNLELHLIPDLNVDTSCPVPLSLHATNGSLAKQIIVSILIPVQI